MTAISGVDYGNFRSHGSNQRRALLGMPDSWICAKQETVRIVSATLSPLDAEQESAEEKPSTLPPRAIMAASKLKRVRVLGS